MRGRYDRWRGPGALVSPDFGATIPDVDRNDGGDDVARGNATGPALFQPGSVTARAWSSVRFNGLLHRRILCGLDALQSHRRIGPMDFARLRDAIPSDDSQ